MAVPQLALSMSGAKVIAAANKARNANSVLHLFKPPFNPEVTSTKEEFLAAECDFDGYAPATLTAWGDPILFGTGWATMAATQTFRWVAGDDSVTNMVAGTFLVSSAGDLLTYQVFANPAPMQGPGQAVVNTPIQVTPAGTFG